MCVFTNIHTLILTYITHTHPSIHTYTPKLFLSRFKHFQSSSGNHVTVFITNSSVFLGSNEETQKILKFIATIQFDMKQIKSTLKEMQASLVAVHQLMSHSKKEDYEVEEAIGTLPIENAEDLRLFEKKLDNKNYFDKMVSNVIFFQQTIIQSIL